MHSMHGADLVIRLLERQGIEVICGIPGGAVLPLYDALLRHGGIRHVLARHEQGAGFMAQGMARATGKTAVFFATSGPGATNTLTALADARADSVPVVCITGQVASPLLGTDAFQEVDTYGMSLPVVKHNFLVRSAEELLRVIPEAFRIAASGRPGPVLVDIPRNIQLAPVEFAQWPEPGTATPRPKAQEPALEQALALLRSAQRPVIMAGGGVMGAGAVEEVRALAQAMGAPVAMSLLGLGTMPEENPLSLGLIGMHGARYTNMIIDVCDLLLVVGARLDDRATGLVQGFCPEAKIIHIDIDPSELGKIRQAHIDIVADAGDCLRWFLEHMPADAAKARAPWLAQVASLKLAHPLHTPGAEDPTTPYGMVRAAARCVPEDTIVVTDVGQHQMRTAQFYPIRHPRKWLTSGGQGTMGFGLPAAIGAALAFPQRTVVCFSGDGSLLMNMQEMATAADQNVNVKIILADNGGLGLIQQLQGLLFEGRTGVWRYERPVDYVKVAEGFGWYAIDLGLSANPAEALQEALKRPGPALVRVAVPAADNVYPQVLPGAANTQMIGN